MTHHAFTSKPSIHIEADTRMFLHLVDAAHSGHTKAYIRTVDSDVVVLAVALFNEIATLTHLWIGFGTGKHYRDIPIHDICKRLTKDEARALLFFHALTGCDTNSQPVNIGKKTAWDRWRSMPEMTQVFIWLLENPEKFTMDSWVWNPLERYLIVQYSKSCSSSSLNDARLKLFRSGNKTLEHLPPTSAAYFQHVKRAILQASFFWRQSLTPQQIIPNFSSYGWKYDKLFKQWVPHWTELSDTSTACAFLVKCGCKKTCHGNCKCLGLRLASGVQVCVVAREAVLTTTIKVQHQHTNKSGRLFLLVTFYARHLCFFVLFQLSRSVKLIFMCQ